MSNKKKFAVLPALSAIVLFFSGRTILNLPAVIRGFDPQPDPPNLARQ